MITASVFVISFVIFIITVYGILLDNTLYCYIFEHSEYKWYKRFNKLNNFYREGSHYKTPDYPNHHVIIDYNGLAFIWNEKTNNCTTCTFYKRGSKKLANKLKNL